LFVKDG